MRTIIPGVTALVAGPGFARRRVAKA